MSLSFRIMALVSECEISMEQLRSDNAQLRSDNAQLRSENTQLKRCLAACPPPSSMMLSGHSGGAPTTTTTAHPSAVPIPAVCTVPTPAAPVASAMPSAAVDGDLQPAVEPCVSTMMNPVAEELARKAKAFDVAEKKRIEKLEKRRKRAALLRERKRNAAARKAEQSSGATTVVASVAAGGSGEGVPTAASNVAPVRKAPKGVKRTAAVAQMNNSAKAGAAGTTKPLKKRARTGDDDDDTTASSCSEENDGKAHD